jgi:AAA domain/CHC2 zinc finger
MSADIREAKQRLPLPALMHRLALGVHAKKSARCPFHDDNRNSFSVYKNGNGEFRWKCFTECGDGDEITFLERQRGISRGEAIKVFLEMAGVNGATSVRSQHLAKRTSEQQPFDWTKCVDALTTAHIEHLARLRGYSCEICLWLKENALIGLHEGSIAFPVQDPAANVVAAHYRQTDGSWRYYPHGIKTRPLVIGELIAGDRVCVFESQWDGLAFMDVSGERSGIIITRGASNGALVADLIPQSSTVYVWTQNDAAGEKWQKDICGNTKATVKRARTPEQFKDLNDWTRAGATDQDLLDAIVKAETVREAEQSWVDALNAAVVTSSELHDLELIPRRKLLGDWFCEGDLGFIFAFRGVGKTWLALAIAQALSTGGKLGEWQAREAVKVLYVDGEMPPDLMRSRCEGLDASNDNLQFLNHEILFDRSGKVLNVANREIQQAITQRCMASGVKVLILDNLSTLASGMRENEADSWELVNSWLLDLRRRKIAVVIVHHAGRSGEMRGTSKREDNVFWIIALDDAKQNAHDQPGARFVSRFSKPSRNTQEQVQGFEWHFVTESSGEVSISYKQAQTLDFFLSLIEDGVRECSQIAEEMKTSPATVSRLAKRAIDAGKIIKKSREYFLVEGNKIDRKP